MPLARFADRAISIQTSGIDRLGLSEATDVLGRFEEFDEIHSWYGANRQEFRDLVAHLPFRFYPSLPPDARQHATDFYLSQVGAVARSVYIRVDPGPAVCQSGITVLHPFSGSARKTWPLEKWVKLAALIGPVQWCCGPEDSLPGAIVIPELYDLARWISGARAFIGNDSGITHLAAAVGTPTIALFGSTDPAVWAPRGPSVTVLRDIPIANISPELVAAAHRAIR